MSGAAWVNRVTGRWLCWTGAHHPTPRAYDQERVGFANSICVRCKKRMWVNWGESRDA